jgi:hypothetical protein
LCLGIFIFSLVRAVQLGLKNIDMMYFFLSVGGMAAAIFFFAKARNKRVYIRINNKGIYQDEKLVTGWANFLNAYVSQKDKMVQIQDNFILVVEYRKGPQQGVRRKIPLTNTQNKSEEEVLAAVKFYWSIFHKKT